VELDGHKEIQFKRIDGSLRHLDVCLITHSLRCTVILNGAVVRKHTLKSNFDVHIT
jgi:hypothetical protein